MKKKDRNGLIALGLFGIVGYTLAQPPKKTRKDYEDEFDLGDVKETPSSGFLEASQAPKNYAIHWNNPSGIIKTSFTWDCLGEVSEPENRTNFKAFGSLTSGYSAQLYNLLTYIELGYDTVSKIVARWTGLKPNTTAFNNYVGVTTFYPTDSIDSWENLKLSNTR
jgi:hypothetical protein